MSESMEAHEERLAKLLKSISVRNGDDSRTAVIFEGPDERYVQFIGVDDHEGEPAAILMEAVSNHFLPPHAQLSEGDERALLEKSPAISPPTEESPNYHLVMVLPPPTMRGTAGTLLPSPEGALPIGLSRAAALRKLAALARELFEDVYHCSDPGKLSVFSVTV